MFCNKKGELGRQLISRSGAGLILTSTEHEDLCRSLSERAFILVDDPRLAFIRVLNDHFSYEWPPGVDPTASISDSAKIGDKVHIGPMCSVGNDVEIGEGSRLECSVVLYDGVRIPESFDPCRGGHRDRWVRFQSERGRRS